MGIRRKSKTKTEEPKEEPKTKGRGKKDKGEKTLTLEQIRAKIRKRNADKPTIIYEDDTDSTPVYPTRFPRLNALLGGGLRAGSIIEEFGFEDSGKSSLSIAMAADIQAQAPKGKNHVVLVNYEGPQPWKWWRTLGLKTDKKHFTQLRPRDLEQGMGDARDLIKTGEVCCLIIDSVYAAAARAREQMMDNWSDEKKKGVALGVEAVKWGEAWTSMKGLFQDHDVVAIAVNQMREIIDTKGGSKSWVKPVTTPRGHALKFYAWVRLEIRGAMIEDQSAEDGRRVRIKVVKNKTSEDSRGRCAYDLIRGVGFDLLSDLIDVATQAGAIKTKGGGFYTIGKIQVRGKEKLRELIKSNDKVRSVLQKCVDTYLSKQDLEEDDGEDDE